MTRLDLASTPLLLLCAPLLMLSACSDDGEVVDPSTTFGTTTTTGDGDGDPAGDGDPDPSTETSGESDSAPAECEDGEEQCTEEGHQLCEGGQWASDPCPEDSFCDEITDECASCVCTPGEQGDCVDDDNIETCKDDCSGFEPASCGGGDVCVDGACAEVVCAADQSYCTGEKTYQLCNGDGTAFEEEQICSGTQVCLAGDCVSACDAAEANKSNVGCEFWGVDMANLPPRDRYTYSIVVANPSETDEASVQIWDKRMGFETAILEDTVAPRDSRVFNISGSHAGYTSYYNGIDAGILGSGLVDGSAFRVQSDLPVIATQFNPIGGASGNTSEASLLLPTHVLGTDYMHLAWALGYGSGSSMNIIATEDDTTITIRPNVSTPAGSNGLPAMNAGLPTIINLDAYDYIQISVPDTNPGPGSQEQALTGSLVTSDKAVAVFGGHSCANVPDESVSACDHIEEQIFPLETWGQNYVASRNPQRLDEPMRWRVLASEDDTTITFDPPSPLGSQVVLDTGQMVEFDSDVDFFTSADKPILMAGYMIGCAAVSPGCTGDPYMVLMVPVEQYQDDYVMLVDDSYSEDFIKLVRSAGQEVTVECLGGPVPDDRWTQVGMSDYEWAVIDANPGEAMCEPGTNQASSSEGFGVIVSGQSGYVSYAYPGGLALDQINPL